MPSLDVSRLSTAQSVVLTPSIQILNLVQVTSDADRIEVGQPVTAAISIRSTFSWSHSSSPTTLALVYDVTFKTEDWLVSGRKRGQFTAEVSRRGVLHLRERC